MSGIMHPIGRSGIALAKEIATARRRMRLSARAVADAIGWSERKVMRVERGLSRLDFDDAATLAVLLRFSLDRCIVPSEAPERDEIAFGEEFGDFDDEGVFFIGRVDGNPTGVTPSGRVIQERGWEGSWELVGQISPRAVPSEDVEWPDWADNRIEEIRLARGAQK